mmetsp:Transcript_24251/g.48528  ORF Transcript_24251/g.48528 Transcript_24251/m.48528 type:complete len:233 (+) Transcript_24251:564-1262(+)
MAPEDRGHDQCHRNYKRKVKEVYEPVPSIPELVVYDNTARVNVFMRVIAMHARPDLARNYPPPVDRHFKSTSDEVHDPVQDKQAHDCNVHRLRAEHLLDTHKVPPVAQRTTQPNGACRSFNRTTGATDKLPIHSHQIYDLQLVIAVFGRAHLRHASGSDTVNLDAIECLGWRLRIASSDFDGRALHALLDHNCRTKVVISQMHHGFPQKIGVLCRMPHRSRDHLIGNALQRG